MALLHSPLRWVDAANESARAPGHSGVFVVYPNIGYTAWAASYSLYGAKHDHYLDGRGEEVRGRQFLHATMDNAKEAAELNALRRGEWSKDSVRDPTRPLPPYVHGLVGAFDGVFGATPRKFTTDIAREGAALVVELRRVARAAIAVNDAGRRIMYHTYGGLRQMVRRPARAYIVNGTAYLRDGPGHHLAVFSREDGRWWLETHVLDGSTWVKSRIDESGHVRSVEASR